MSAGGLRPSAVPIALPAAIGGRCGRAALPARELLEVGGLGPTALLAPSRGAAPVRAVALAVVAAAAQEEPVPALPTPDRPDPYRHVPAGRADCWTTATGCATTDSSTTFPWTAWGLEVPLQAPTLDLPYRLARFVTRPPVSGNATTRTCGGRRHAPPSGDVPNRRPHRWRAPPAARRASRHQCRWPTIPRSSPPANRGHW